MIGKTIDRAALTLLGTMGLYLYFLNAGIGIAGSCALAFVCASLARYALRHRPRRRKITLKQAEAALDSIAMMGEDEAGMALRTLAGREDALMLIRHPEGTFTLNELFETWRERGDGAAFVVTCAAEAGAAQFAKARGMTLMDKSALLKRIRATGLYVPREAPSVPFSRRLEGLWNGIHIRPRTLLYSMSLLTSYLITGQALCLVCALGLLGVMGMKLIGKYA